MDHRFSRAALAAAIALASCGAGNNHPATHGYRDLKGYFKQELAEIRQNRPALHKTVIFNNRRDSTVAQPADTARYQELLQPFLEVDLNISSLQGAYDTVLLPDQFTRKRSLMYKARKTTVNPQEVILNINNHDQIESVSINRYIRNLVYEYRQNLVYQHNRHVRVSTWQKIILMPATELDVKVLLAPHQ